MSSAGLVEGGLRGADASVNDLSMISVRKPSSLSVALKAQTVERMQLKEHRPDTFKIGEHTFELIFQARYVSCYDIALMCT